MKRTLVLVSALALFLAYELFGHEFVYEMVHERIAESATRRGAGVAGIL
jgi:hypothetical protein